MKKEKYFSHNFQIMENLVKMYFHPEYQFFASGLTISLFKPRMNQAGISGHICCREEEPPTLTGGDVSHSLLSRFHSYAIRVTFLHFL